MNLRPLQHHVAAQHLSPNLSASYSAHTQASFLLQLLLFVNLTWARNICFQYSRYSKMTPVWKILGQFAGDFFSNVAANESTIKPSFSHLMAAESLGVQNVSYSPKWSIHGHILWPSLNNSFILILSTFSSIQLGLDDWFRTLIPNPMQMDFFCYAEVKFWLL